MKCSAYIYIDIYIGEKTSCDGATFTYVQPTVHFAPTSKHRIWNLSTLEEEDHLPREENSCVRATLGEVASYPSYQHCQSHAQVGPQWVQPVQIPQLPHYQHYTGRCNEGSSGSKN